MEGTDGGLFHFHENPNPTCPVGKNIHTVLDGRLAAVQRAMEEELKKVSLYDLTQELNSKIAST